MANKHSIRLSKKYNHLSIYFTNSSSSSSSHTFSLCASFFIRLFLLKKLVTNIDIMITKVSGAPGENIAVIMAGYQSPMLKMLRDQNPGLSRRFSPSNALHFDDFADDELLQIVSGECQRLELYASLDVKLRAVKLLAQQRALPNFGNAGAAKNLLAEVLLVCLFCLSLSVSLSLFSSL